MLKLHVNKPRPIDRVATTCGELTRMASMNATSTRQPGSTVTRQTILPTTRVFQTLRHSTNISSQISTMQKWNEEELARRLRTSLVIEKGMEVDLATKAAARMAKLHMQAQAVGL